MIIFSSHSENQKTIEESSLYHYVDSKTRVFWNVEKLSSSTKKGVRNFILPEVTRFGKQNWHSLSIQRNSMLLCLVNILRFSWKNECWIIYNFILHIGNMYLMMFTQISNYCFLRICRFNPRCKSSIINSIKYQTNCKPITFHLVRQNQEYVVFLCLQSPNSYYFLSTRHTVHTIHQSNCRLG